MRGLMQTATIMMMAGETDTPEVSISFWRFAKPPYAMLLLNELAELGGVDMPLWRRKFCELPVPVFPSDDLAISLSHTKRCPPGTSISYQHIVLSVLYPFVTQKRLVLRQSTALPHAAVAEVRRSTSALGIEVIGYAEHHRRFPRRFETVRLLDKQ